jgi:hypothetical protein
MAAIDGAHFDALVNDLDRSVEQLLATVGRDPSVWSRGRPGKWTAGQHAEHVTKALELHLSSFEENRRRMDVGDLGRQPRHGLLEELFHAVIVRPGWMPRGGPAVPPTFPSDLPNPADVSRRMREAVGRFRALGAGLDPAARDRLWIRNPNMPTMRWHYSLPESVRIQAVHVRHHGTQIAELLQP